jgi:hypothetical protein
MTFSSWYFTRSRQNGIREPVRIEHSSQLGLSLIDKVMGRIFISKRPYQNAITSVSGEGWYLLKEFHRLA